MKRKRTDHFSNCLISLHSIKTYVTVHERVQREPEFAAALLDEAVTLFLNGESDTARLILRDLFNATAGFEALANETAKPSKSLHRMLSANGNPTMDNLSAI